MVRVSGADSPGKRIGPVSEPSNGVGETLWPVQQTPKGGLPRHRRAGRLPEEPAWNTAWKKAGDWEATLRELVERPELSESEKADARQMLEDVRSVFEHKQSLRVKTDEALG